MKLKSQGLIHKYFKSSKSTLQHLIWLNKYWSWETVFLYILTVHIEKPVEIVASNVWDHQGLFKSQVLLTVTSSNRSTIKLLTIRSSIFDVSAPGSKNPLIPFKLPSLLSVNEWKYLPYCRADIISWKGKHSPSFWVVFRFLMSVF